MRPGPWLRLAAVPLALLVIALSGCTSLRDYVHHGFKVGPNYSGATACTAQHWIDQDDARIRAESGDLSQWWGVFSDPVLDRLIVCAYQQNLSLREAGCRVLQARAQLAIARGNFFPQVQTATGNYQRLSFSGAGASAIPDYAKQKLRDLAGIDLTLVQFAENWNFGFNLGWELDFWGRFRRAITSAEENLEASAAGYDQVVVTMLGDVAGDYAHIRTLQKRLELLRANVELQRSVVSIAQRRWDAGRTNKADVAQARSDLARTEAQIPQVQIELRETCNALCVLMGIPPAELSQQLGVGPIPTAPAQVVVGIPAELLRRRPDVRRAERLAAAQAEQIGIAEVDLYPIFSISGSLAWQAQTLPQLFEPNALGANVGPGFRWNILNYGRIRSNMCLQTAKLDELVTIYQEIVLRANAEVENGIARFLQSQEQARSFDESVVNEREAFDVIVRQYNAGTVDFTRVALIEQDLVLREDLQTQSHGQIAQGLIQVYRALGGGWEAPPQWDESAQGGAPPAAASPPPEVLPLPSPAAPRPQEKAPAPDAK